MWQDMGQISGWRTYRLALAKPRGRRRFMYVRQAVSDGTVLAETETGYVRRFDSVDAAKAYLEEQG